MVVNDYFLSCTDDSKALKHLGMNVLRHFGCYNCDWRGTEMCSYGFPKGVGKKLSNEQMDKLKGEYICELRVNFLRSIYSGKGKGIMGYKQLCRDYRDYGLNQDSARIKNELSVIEEQLEHNELKLNDKEINKLNHKKENLRERLHDLDLKLNKLHENELDRESRDKNFDKIKSTWTVNDLSKMMLGDVVEGDYTDKN
jgi:hypothetical protein